jgi:hypothetical protein
MKMFNLKSLALTALSIVMALVFATQVSAMSPNLSLTSNGNGLIQVTVSADANANIILDYYSGGQLLGAGLIGQTNYSGYFNGTLTASAYTIPSGAQVIVMVNGLQSAPTTWPTVSNYNNGCVYNCPPVYNNNQITLSISNLNLTIGQTQTVTINNGTTYNNNYYSGGQYYVSNTGNNTVNATVSGSTLTLYGQSVGTTTLTICSNNNAGYGYTSYNNGCATLLVNVTGDTNYNYNYNDPYNYNNQNYQYNTYPYNTYNNNYNNYTAYNALSVSNNNVQVTVGNAGVVTLYGSNTPYQYSTNGALYPYTTNGRNGSNYYVTTTNNGIATATVNGNTLTVYGTGAGTTAVNVCSIGSNQCAVVNVTVIAPVNNYYTNNGPYVIYNTPYDYPTQPGNWYYSYPDHCWHRQG